MINQDEFEVHEHVVEWLYEHGVPFESAMAIVSYAIQMNISIPVSYMELNWGGVTIEKGKDEEKKDA